MSQEAKIAPPPRGSWDPHTNSLLMEVMRHPSGDYYGLFYLPHNHGTPFVTWYMGNDGSCPISKKVEDPGFSLGRYHVLFYDAKRDLENRARK